MRQTWEDALTWSKHGKTPMIFKYLNSQSIYLDFQSTDYTDLVANQFVFVYLGKLKLTIFDYQ